MRTNDPLLRRNRYAPLAVNGCVLWLRADMGITLNGGNVSAWADQSGQGNHATQATAGLQPAWVSSGAPFGGAPYVNFQDTGRVLATPSFLLQHHTIVWVGYQASPWYCFIRNASGFGAGCWRVFGDLTPPGGGGSLLRATGAQYSGKNVSSTWVVTGGIAKTWAWQYGGTHASSLLTNNESNVSLTDSSYTDNASDNISGPLYVYGMKVPEVLLYNRVLSSAEYSVVYNYLRRRYGHY